MKLRRALSPFYLLAGLYCAVVSPALSAAPLYHAIAMHGQPKYDEGFSHFDYTRPDAPKGGTLKRHVTGTFDSLNGFISKGSSAAGLGALYDTLTVQSLDEPFTAYGLLAEKMEMPEDRSWITFHLRPEARFSDGHPVTADDVVFSFNALIEKGAPFYAYYYGDVARVEALSAHKVTFHFKPGTNKELALIIGQLPVFPEHYWAKHDFGKATLSPPIGSGPYRIQDVAPGKTITYARRDDYWGKDLPVNRGKYNFDHITYEYFLDETVALEAFKSGTYDLRLENNSKLWATAYQHPRVARGDIVKEEINHSLPAGMQGFVFNLRKPLFQDRTLREALAYAFDFEWSNDNLFYGQYKRTRSYFENSELAATGLPSEAELTLLKPWKAQLPEEVFTQAYQPPRTQGPSGIRTNLRQASQLLRNAGYTVQEGILITPDGQPVTFEILLLSPAFERIVLPFAENLKKLGVHVDVRKVDQPQYLDRLRNFNFDMVIYTFGQSLSPGNEQRDYWHSTSATRPDSRNLIGIQHPAVDALIDKIIEAPDRASLITACRALDRVLQWGHYVIPNWHINQYRIAYDRKLTHPGEMPPYGFSLDIWWVQDSEKDQ